MDFQWDWMIFAFGCLGASFPECLRWYRLRERDKLPKYAKNPRYWMLTLLFIIIGGILSTIYGTMTIMTPFLAVTIGASAPLIISTIAMTIPEKSNKKEYVPMREMIHLQEIRLALKEWEKNPTNIEKYERLMSLVREYDAEYNWERKMQQMWVPEDYWQRLIKQCMEKLDQNIPQENIMTFLRA